MKKEEIVKEIIKLEEEYRQIQSDLGNDAEAKKRITSEASLMNLDLGTLVWYKDNLIDRIKYAKKFVKRKRSR